MNFILLFLKILFMLSFWYQLNIFFKLLFSIRLPLFICTLLSLLISFSPLNLTHLLSLSPFSPSSALSFLPRLISHSCFSCHSFLFPFSYLLPRSYFIQLLSHPLLVIPFLQLFHSRSSAFFVSVFCPRLSHPVSCSSSSPSHPYFLFLFVRLSFYPSPRFFLSLFFFFFLFGIPLWISFWNFSSNRSKLYCIFCVVTWSVVPRSQLRRKIVARLTVGSNSLSLLIRLQIFRLLPVTSSCGCPSRFLPDKSKVVK